MKILRSIILYTVVIIFMFGSPCYVSASSTPQVQAVLHPPQTTLKMGDTPTFRGDVKNTGQETLEGLVVYLSLVSLEKGNEHPVDLEDWSAQKAVRIAKLLPGETNQQQWSMRLISAGKFALALTVVEAGTAKPVISDLLEFNVLPQKLISSTRILSVAIGEPLLIIVLILAVNQGKRLRRKGQQRQKI
ncbi:MAG: hypothetical protein A2Y13_04560 [Planctomycetes bacterium GWC2_45_44]|nr:MAG: hypothetical protein A2Y13_04560 [Planctomycetes bacterium GWC2_45_44]